MAKKSSKKKKKTIGIKRKIQLVLSDREGLLPEQIAFIETSLEDSEIDEIFNAALQDHIEDKIPFEKVLKEVVKKVGVEIELGIIKRYI